MIIIIYHTLTVYTADYNHTCASKELSLAPEMMLPVYTLPKLLHMGCHKLCAPHALDIWNRKTWMLFINIKARQLWVSSLRMTNQPTERMWTNLDWCDTNNESLNVDKTKEVTKETCSLYPALHLLANYSTLLNSLVYSLETSWHGQSSLAKETQEQLHFMQ